MEKFKGRYSSIENASENPFMTSFRKIIFLWWRNAHPKHAPLWPPPVGEPTAHVFAARDRKITATRERQILLHNHSTVQPYFSCAIDAYESDFFESKIKKNSIRTG
jgi:hypothetical protein